MNKLLGLAFFAFFMLSTPVRAGDSDDDGIPNKYDNCPNDPEDMDEFEDNDGCPDPDNDKDGVCEAWVTEKGESAKFASVCKSSDKCPTVKEDKDGFEDTDGCPDPDNDKDGIPDDKDKCVMDPEDRDGFEDFDGCPEPDNDKDGSCDAWIGEKNLGSKYASVCTGTDKCPVVQEDKDGFEDEDGCPELDNDKDGIPDTMDKCPLVMENVNGIQDEDGCPDKMNPPLQKVQTFPLVQFRTATAEMTLEGEAVLTQFAKQLAEYPDTIVEVRVFSWYKGRKRDDYLKMLQDRSKVIVDFLVGKGVKPEQIKEVSYTQENSDANKGSESDFNQEKPMEVHLLN